MSNKWAFSEVFDDVDIDNQYPVDKLPIGLKKCQQFGIRNVMLEIDLNYYRIDYSKFTGKSVLGCTR